MENYEGSKALIGRWLKRTSTPGSELYPDLLEFTDGGMFKGENAPDSRQHPLWDAGRYEVTGDRLRLPTSYDANNSYPFRATQESLILVTEQHGELHYRRQT